MHHGSQEQRRIGHAARDHDLRAFRQSIDDGSGPEIGFGRNQRVGNALRRGTGLQDGGCQRQHAVGDQAAAHGRHLDAGDVQLAQQLDDAPCCTLRVDPPLVGDDARALAHAGRQHGSHAVVEIGVVAREGRVPSGPDLCGGDRGLGHGLEAQVVEPATLGIEGGGLDAVAPPGGSRAYAQDLAVIHCACLRCSPRPGG